MKVPAATYDAAIQANYLSATEGVFAFTHVHKRLVSEQTNRHTQPLYNIECY